MGEISKSITVEATPAQVYRYVSNPQNAPRFISSITSIDAGTQAREGVPVEGQSWRAQANLLGQARAISLVLEELRRDRLVRYGIRGDPPVQIEVRLDPRQSGKETEVTLQVQTPAAPSIILNAVLGNMLAGDLRRLKAILENDSSQ